jgi:hypothetical protein
LFLNFVIFHTEYVKSINENVEGFTAYIQMIEQPHVLHTIRDTIFLRDKVDNRIDVALDFHGRCTPAMASVLGLLQ